METKILVVVKTRAPKVVLPEEGTTEKDYTREEIKVCREDYSRELHDEVVRKVGFALDSLEDDEELLEESYIEGHDDWENDYGIKITHKIQKKK